MRKLLSDDRQRKLSTLSVSTPHIYGCNLKRIDSCIASVMVSEVSASDAVSLIEKSTLGWVEANTLLIVRKKICRFAKNLYTNLVPEYVQIQ